MVKHFNFLLFFLILLLGFFLFSSSTTILKMAQPQIPSSLLETNDNILEFITGQTQTLDSENLTEKEYAHLLEVDRLFSAFRAIYFALILIFLLSLTNKEIKPKNIEKPLFYTLFVLFILFVTPFFRFSFDLFHKIFFPQGNYLFPINSALLTLYPSIFFIKIILASMVISLLTYLILSESFREKSLSCN